mgnify:FL=1
MTDRFNVEETNLLSIYRSDTRKETIQNMNAALPDMDEDMKELTQEVLTKLQKLTEKEFTFLILEPADEIE